MNRYTFTLAVGLCASAAWAQEPYDKAAERAFEREVIANREKGLYKRIDWKESPAAARREAERLRRPILVFIVVGEMGRKGASDC